MLVNKDNSKPNVFWDPLSFTFVSD